MTEQATKQEISSALRQFGDRPLGEASLALLSALGYHSEKRLNMSFPTPKECLAELAPGRPFNKELGLCEDWRQVIGLFQLTEKEVMGSGQRHLEFGGKGVWNNAIIESYLFFAVELKGTNYTRSQLAGLTREFNKLFAMPVMVLVLHGGKLTLEVINRRLHKRDVSKDVLEKVTLIRAIETRQPHRAHIEILHDLSVEALYRKHEFKNFVELHEAWQRTLDSTELNKRFYRDIANWFFWASKHVVFPQPKGALDSQAYIAQSLIRLLTRLIFCWFLKEKGLIPEDLFNWSKLQPYLTGEDAKQSDYYKVVLQNLFFATLNTQMDEPGRTVNRHFSSKSYTHHMVHTAYRYESLVKEPEGFLKLFHAIPFLNGGLFECLDDRAENGETRIDGFSDHPRNPLTVPNFLFFGPERVEDLSKDYGERRYSKVTVRPLITILDQYKFTITENTPIEQEIALDPELLGLVFENLLAAYNPETNMTARKLTGSFYTPREVVDFMVDETLIAYLEAQLRERCGEGRHSNRATQQPHEARLRHLLAYNDEPHQFSQSETTCLIEALDRIKILDPACGSGAFPMGALHKMVYILRKLDPANVAWKARQLAKVSEIPDATARDRAREAIEEAFARNEDDYGRKLYLIENCLYGVDIQPIAVQIAKLRCFISLVVEQRVNDRIPNRGILALPNLETKFVAANTVLALGHSSQTMLRNPQIGQKEQELRQVRHDYFTAKRYQEKKALKQKDQRLRDELVRLLRQEDAFPAEEARKLAHWDPYDPNAAADFFDPEWMFALREDFDIVISNPPYVRQEEIKAYKPILKEQYHCFTGVADLYVYFYERGFDLLKIGGALCYISSNKYFRSGYGERLRHFLATNGQILQLIDFGDTPVFTSIAYPSIIVVRKIRETRNKADLPSPKAHAVQKAASGDGNQVQVLTWEPGEDIVNFPTIFSEQSFRISQGTLTSDGWRLESPTIERLLEKVRRAGVPLGEYVKGRFYYGIKTGLNEAFVVDRATRDKLIEEHRSSKEVLKPFVRGRDVKRWSVDFAEQYLIKIESSENKVHPWSGKSEREAEKSFARSYPAIHRHFEDFRASLKKRDDQGKYFWELRSCVYWQEFERPKIFIPAIEQGVAYAPDYKRYFGNDKTSICVTEQLPLVLGLLNSQILWWFFKKIAATKQGGFFEFKPMYVTQLPVASGSKSLEDQIIKLVNDVISSKESSPDASVTNLETHIDGFVAHLYGLSEEEFTTILKDADAPDPVRVGALNAYRDAARGVLA